MAHAEKKDTDSIQRILKASEEVFAEKGFDGARVDEIAARAGVNKALIYYYFESKDHILKELSKKHVQEIMDSKEVILKEMMAAEGGFNRELIGKMMETFLWSLLGERKDFLRIVLIETLKSKSGNTFFFELVNQLVDDALVKFEKLGYEIDYDQFKTIAFFYGHIPTIFYMTMWEQWAEFNHLDKVKVKSAFIDALTEIEFTLFLDKFKLVMDEKMVNTLYREKPDSSIE